MGRVITKKETVLKKLAEGNLNVHNASEELYKDDELVKQMISFNGRALCDASEKLRGDRSIVTEAIKDGGWIFNFATDELINDDEFVLFLLNKYKDASIFNAVMGRRGYSYPNIEALAEKAMEICPNIYKDIPNSLWARPEIALSAVKADANNIAFVPEELRDNEDIMYETIKVLPYALDRYASERLKRSKEFIYRLLNDDIDVTLYIYRNLFDDDLIYKCVSLNGDHIMSLYDLINKNSSKKAQILETAVKNGTVNAFSFLCGVGVVTKELTLIAVERNWQSIVYAPDSLKNDKDVIKQTIKSAMRISNQTSSFPLVWSYIGDELLEDEAYIISLIRFTKGFIIRGINEARRHYITDNMLYILVKEFPEHFEWIINQYGINDAKLYSKLLEAYYSSEE